MIIVGFEFGSIFQSRYRSFEGYSLFLFFHDIVRHNNNEFRDPHSQVFQRVVESVNVPLHRDI